MKTLCDLGLYLLIGISAFVCLGMVTVLCMGICRIGRKDENSTTETKGT